MNQLIVVALDNLADARTAMKRLRSLEDEGKVSFEDTAIIERMPDGTARVRHELSGATETGAVIGAVIGAIALSIFPLAGIAAGALLGGAVGAAFDTGVSPQFVEDVKDKLSPGRSALFLVVREADADATVAALRGLEGDVVQTTLDAETEESLRRALS